jgi:DNA-binding MarR family transcriptional regulator
VTRFVGGPAAGPGYLLWCVTLSWQRAVTAALRPLGLTHVQFVLLVSTWWLHEHGRGPSQVELARHAAIDVKMTSQVVRTLEGKGLLAREQDAGDARVRRLRPTVEGATLARRAVVVVEEADQGFFGDEAGAAVSVLQRLLPADSRSLGPVE